ncbi:olfactory receptor 2A7-like [Pelobates fuscus]|uniref:olfactory receptor 2A7-like n=1 Tax=Pelobates fuscus TaxID=191477 RepID=UPI002FE4543E
MLLDMISVGGGRISLTGCMLQMVIGLFLGETEFILLAVMAYDRYIAICFPFRYMVIMSWKRCKNVIIVVWVGSFLLTFLPYVSQQHTFCKGNKINHFVCESIALLKLVCEDTFFDETMVFFGSLLTILVPFAFILVTYICIIIAIIKIKSSDGRTKAFSTCVSHLTVVCMFYGTSMSMYLGPTKHVSEKHKFICIIYAIVTPMLNPLIYSLRNQDVNGEIRKLFIKSMPFLAVSQVKGFEKTIIRVHVNNHKRAR